MPNRNLKERTSLLPRISVTRPVTVTMCLAALLAIGVVSYVRIPIKTLVTGLAGTRGTRIWVNVFTEPNTSPQEKDELIGQPMVAHLRTLKGLREFWVTSDTWRTYARLDFRKGLDMSLVYNRLVDRLEHLKAVLPERYRDDIRIWKHNPDSDEEVLWIGVTVPPHVEDRYAAVQSRVQPLLERIDGVAQARIWGANQRVLVVEMDRERMQMRGVSSYHLVQALREDNFEMAGGNVFEGEKKLFVRSMARYESLEAFEQILVHGRGGPVYLAEVARLFYDAPQRISRYRLNGAPGLSLAIFRESGANIVEVCDRVESALKQIEAETGFEFNVFYSQGKLIRDSIQNLRDAGLWGGLFAALVLLFFLRALRMTALITLAIPVSVMFAVTALYFMGWSLNLLTMMGLMVAIGMVVDNAIVVVENIYRMRDRGEDPHRSSAYGATQVGLAITMATLTTVVVFLPLIVMSGDVDLSFFLSKIGLPIIAALLGSLLVALFFIPLAAKRFGGSLVSAEPRLVQRARSGYSRALKWSLNHRIDTTLLVLALFATLFYPIRNVKRSDSLQGVSNTVSIYGYPPKFLTWEELSNIGSEVEAFLESKKEIYGIRNVQFRYNRSSKGRLRFRLYLEEEPNRAWWHQLYSGLAERVGLPVDRRMDRRAVIEDLNRKFPEFVGIDYVIASGSVGDPFMHIALWGDDMETLAKLRGEVELRMQAIPSITGITSDVERGDDEVHVVIDRKRAREYGVSPRIVGQSLGYQLGGVELPRYRSEAREVDVRLYLGRLDRQTLKQLKGFTFSSASGKAVPLSAFASFRVTKGDLTLRRRDGKIRLLLKMYTTREDLKGLYEEMDRAMEGFEMPQGYSWDKGERYEKFLESEETMRFAVILAITCVFLLMGVLFESLILPFSVLFCIPFAFLGVYWTLFLTDTVMDRMAQVGMIVLIGVVVNNAIVLVDRVNRLRAEGLDRGAAILEAGANRFRPILMTSFTTIFGLLPMALSSSELMGVPYSSMGRAMIGGLLCATFLTLFVVPLFYTYLDDLRVALRRTVSGVLARPQPIAYRGPEPAD